MSERTSWKNEPLGQVANLIMGQSPESNFYSDEEIGLPFLQGCAEFGSRFPAHAVYCSQPKKVAPKNSILFSVRAPVGRINIADRDYIIGRGLAAIIGTRVNQRYLEQFLKFQEANFRSASQGSTFEAINSSELSKWSIEAPSGRLEQSKIVEILSTVDQAIDQTEALIAKQQRIKTGLMQDLLTRGIDENGNLRSEETHEFKDSPLGRIPVEWNIQNIDSISDFVTSGARGWAKYYSDEGAAFLRIGNLTRDHINLRFDDTVFVRPPVRAEGLRTLVVPGDVLISVTADLGMIGVIPEGFGEGYVNQHIALVRITDPEVDQRFVGWFLQSRAGQSQFERHNESGAKAGLNLPTIRSLLVASPPLDEQNHITKVLDANTEMISRLQAELNKQSHLKAALMQDLLTGKVSVTPLLTEEECNA